MTVPGTTSAASGTSCAALVTALPRKLGTATRRSVADPAAAAWGDPPITLRCGVPAGSGLDEPYVFDGVRWAVHDDGGTNRWTTIGLATQVRVVVPDAYDAQAELLIALSPALKRVVRPATPAS